MKLPNGEYAVVNLAKLRDYSLNLEHDTGKHKARVFLSALGVKIIDAEWLREKLLEQAATAEVTPKAPTRFGDLYVLDFELRRAEKAAMVRSTWIILKGEQVPRLVTCFVR
jgi:hypothetical protein